MADMVGDPEQRGRLIDGAVLVDQEVGTIRARFLIAAEGTIRRGPTRLMDDDAVDYIQLPSFDAEKIFTLILSASTWPSLVM